MTIYLRHYRDHGEQRPLGRGGPAERDTGAASAELVLATPLLLLLLLLVVQYAVYLHAVHVAQAAAADALAAARGDGGSAGVGAQRAQAVLTQLGRTVVLDPAVRVDRDPNQVDVSVSGHAQPVLPWLKLPVRAESNGPVERFTADVSGRQ